MKKSHPSMFLSSYLEAFEQVTEIEMSSYTYVPQSVSDPRTTSRHARHNWKNHYEMLVSNLRDDREVALHSRVYTVEGIRHIPMVDFASAISREAFTVVRDIMQEFSSRGCAIYCSGRSYHAYGLGVLTSEEWVRFMGRLLLLNSPDSNPIVDTRWVGHRIVAGYGSLRWTANTDHYIHEPILEQAYGELERMHTEHGTSLAASL